MGGYAKCIFELQDCEASGIGSDTSVSNFCHLASPFPPTSYHAFVSI